MILLAIQYTSTLLSGGGARHSLVVITPKLVSKSISDDIPSMTPVVTSFKGVPAIGLSVIRINKPQQLNNEKTVTKIYPMIRNLEIR